jgi:hypothetical protein
MLFQTDGKVIILLNDNFILRKFVFGLREKVLDTIHDDLLYISPQELNKQSFNGNKIYYLQHILSRISECPPTVAYWK